MHHAGPRPEVLFDVPTLHPLAPVALGGPEWLQRRREQAAERLAGLELPTPDEPIWRYSRIDRLELDRYRPASDDGVPNVPGAALRWLDAVGPRAGLVVTVDGRVAALEAPRDGEVLVGPAAQDALGAVMGEATDAFAQMNDAFTPEPVLVEAAPRRSVDEPVVVVHWLSGDGVAAFPRLVVRARTASSLNVVEIVASADVVALVAPVVELVVERDARLGYLNVQRLGPRVWQLGTQVASVDTQARLVSAAAAFGGEYARVRADCRLVGRGASGDLVSLYYGAGDQMLDFRTFQDHQAADTTSDLLFKGVVDERSHSVYTGLIRVRPEARGTNAFQTNRNIKLGEHAWAESVPNLEIENNEVKCSHASTVGPIDEEQRFYLESRGVPPRIADRMIVRGFFDEVIARLPVPTLAPLVHAEVAAKLDGGVVGAAPAAAAEGTGS